MTYKLTKPIALASLAALMVCSCAPGPGAGFARVSLLKERSAPTPKVTPMPVSVIGAPCEGTIDEVPPCEGTIEAPAVFVGAPGAFTIEGPPVTAPMVVEVAPAGVFTIEGPPVTAPMVVEVAPVGVVIPGNSVAAGTSTNTTSNPTPYDADRAAPLLAADAAAAAVFVGAPGAFTIEGPPTAVVEVAPAGVFTIEGPPVTAPMVVEVAPVGVVIPGNSVAAGTSTNTTSNPTPYDADRAAPLLAADAAAVDTSV